LTLRDNILFGSEFDKRKYVQTISGCQLEADLAMMVAGDMSEIGQRGINLSGGQKARLSLARAVYTDPDIILLDDPISALDAVVKKKVFKQVFNGLLRDKTRILVTHAVEFIHLADRVVLMKDGRIGAVGTPEELKDHEYIRELAEIQAKNREEAEKRSQQNRNSIEAALDNVVPDDQLLQERIAQEEARKKLEKTLDAETN
jgi:ABC-type bacteriocin/lantibiotic exporter with double-glycine peptidase domain